MNEPQDTTSQNRSQNKVSWVEFLRSIRFDQSKAQRKKTSTDTECSSHFARFDQHVPSTGISAEDQYLVRSAN